ncbi:hypothetical protein ACFQS2_06935 [Brachybacterium sp. GCM10030267]|uniref:hypothetical protein n=1 Tax=unclassified Brachybacterium TaxID=2623841 RepID=UPI0036067231
MPPSTNTTVTVAADGVGAVSTVLGGLLTIAPLTSGRWLGLADTDAGHRRLLGITDLGLGITILAGRSSPRRWCAVASRSLLHVAFAREYSRHGRRSAAVAMCALFVIDAGIAAGLRVGRRSV